MNIRQSIVIFAFVFMFVAEAHAQDDSFELDEAEFTYDSSNGVQGMVIIRLATLGGG